MKTDSISHSGLSRVKMALCRQRMPPPHMEYLVTGTAVHARDLEGDYKQELTTEQERDATGMLLSLATHGLYQELKRGARFEQEVRGIVHGQAMHGFIDILHRTHIGDIKTTSTKSLREFEKAARKYGYFRQAYVYCKMVGVKQFFFVGVHKVAPWDVFILHTMDYPDDMAYAQEEVKFLISLYKQYPHLANK